MMCASLATKAALLRTRTRGSSASRWRGWCNPRSRPGPGLQRSSGLRGRRWPGRACRGEVREVRVSRGQLTQHRGDSEDNNTNTSLIASETVNNGTQYEDEAEVDNMLRSQEKLLTQSAVLGMTGVVSPCWLPASIKYPPSCRGSCRLVMAQSAQWAEEADKNLCSPARVRGPSGRQIKPPGGWRWRGTGDIY